MDNPAQAPAALPEDDNVVQFQEFQAPEDDEGFDEAIRNAEFDAAVESADAVEAIVARQEWMGPLMARVGEFPEEFPSYVRDSLQNVFRSLLFASSALCWAASPQEGFREAAHSLPDYIPIEFS